MAQRKIRTAFEHAVAAARLEDFVFHDCRHHFASWFMMRGGSLRALQEILGHADLKMTMRYAHLSPEHLRQEMAKTEGSMPGAFSTQSAQGPVAAVDSGDAASEMPDSLGAEGGIRSGRPSAHPAMRRMFMDSSQRITYFRGSGSWHWVTRNEPV